MYDFGRFPEAVLSAKLLGEGSVTANGKPVRCAIIRLHWRSEIGRPQAMVGDEETIWIAKSSGLVLRANFDELTHAGKETIEMSVHGKPIVRTIDANEGFANAIQKWSTSFTSYKLNCPRPDWLHGIRKREQAQARALSAQMAGKTAPEFTLNDLEGKPVSLENSQGKIVLLDFWATWCGTCRQEEPVLDRIRKKFGPGSLAVLRITDQSPELVRSYFNRTGRSFATLVDGEKVSQDYKVFGLPTLVVINKSGKIASYIPGSLSETDLTADLARAGL
jgi:thiol-disulfide isomerase/thioredoxin